MLGGNTLSPIPGGPKHTPIAGNDNSIRLFYLQVDLDQHLPYKTSFINNCNYEIFYLPVIFKLSSQSLFTVPDVRLLSFFLRNTERKMLNFHEINGS